MYLTIDCFFNREYMSLLFSPSLGHFCIVVNCQGHQHVTFGIDSILLTTKIRFI